MKPILDEQCSWLATAREVADLEYQSRTIVRDLSILKSKTIDLQIQMSRLMLKHSIINIVFSSGDETADGTDKSMQEVIESEVHVLIRDIANVRRQVATLGHNQEMIDLRKLMLIKSMKDQPEYSFRLVARMARV